MHGVANSLAIKGDLHAIGFCSIGGAVTPKMNDFREHGCGVRLDITEPEARNGRVNIDCLRKGDDVG